MKKNLSVKEYILIASMLFGMLFGAGNLIFPVSLGQRAASAMIPATAGFCITGVGLPLLAIAAMGLSGSDGLLEMSSRVGKGFGIFFTCALYLSIGPLFAIPRTATVPYQVGIAPFVPEGGGGIALFLFSLCFFGAALYFSLRPTGILTWVGKILNPLFLLFLGILLGMVFLHPMTHSLEAPVSPYLEHSFFAGILEGYNTMDVMGALAFGNILINTIKSLGIREEKRISYSTVLSGCFSCFLMGFIYFALSYGGAMSRNLFGVDENGGDALHHIAAWYFGRGGAVLLGVIISFSCLKTAIGLITSCSMAFGQLFPRISYSKFVLAFTFFSLVISNAGLSKIIAFSIPGLRFLYPVGIVLIFLCLFGGCFQYTPLVFKTAMGFTLVFALLEGAAALPAQIGEKIIFLQGVRILAGKMPLAALGLGWLLPALFGTALGLAGYRIGHRRRH